MYLLRYKKLSGLLNFSDIRHFENGIILTTYREVVFKISEEISLIFLYEKRCYANFTKYTALKIWHESWKKKSQVKVLPIGFQYVSTRSLMARKTVKKIFLSNCFNVIMKSLAKFWMYLRCVSKIVAWKLFVFKLI